MTRSQVLSRNRRRNDTSRSIRRSFYHDRVDQDARNLSASDDVISNAVCISLFFARFVTIARWCAIAALTMRLANVDVSYVNLTNVAQ